MMMYNFRFNYNYGVNGFLDWLHGTDSLFKETVAGKRNVTLLTLKSARELFPDEMKKKS